MARHEMYRTSELMQRSGSYMSRCKMPFASCTGAKRPDLGPKCPDAKRPDPKRLGPIFQGPKHLYMYATYTGAKSSGLKCQPLKCDGAKYRGT